MSIVNVRYGLIPRRQIDDVFERRDVSIHAEDSVGNNEDSPETISILQLLFQVSHIFVLVDSPLSLGHSRAVNNASVIELVANDQVPLINKRKDRPRVRGVTRLKRDR